MTNFMAAARPVAPWLSFWVGLFASEGALACSAPPLPLNLSATAADAVVVGRVFSISPAMPTSLYPEANIRVERVVTGSFGNKTVRLALDGPCGPTGPIIKPNQRAVVYLDRGEKGWSVRGWLMFDDAAVEDMRVIQAFPAPRRRLVKRYGGAIPRGDPAGWVTNDDYPASARRAGATGYVKVQVEVLPEGKAGRCEVLVSSGSPDLDEATCRNLVRRARFKPPLTSEEATSTYEHKWRAPSQE